MLLEDGEPQLEDEFVGTRMSDFVGDKSIDE